MKDDLQEKWMKLSNVEELEGSMLENSLGCEIVVVGLKADVLQVFLEKILMEHVHSKCS